MDDNFQKQQYENNIFFNPILLFILIFVIICFVFFSFSLGNSDGSNFTLNGENSYVKIIGFVLISLFILLVIINSYKYFFGINIITSVKNLFTKNPEIDIDIYTPTPENVKETETETETQDYFSSEQVFNIPGNIYNYEDAKAVCSAFDSKLATYDQIEKYYNDGGEFCNYGWSEGQMALFPTQKETYNKLKNKKGHEHDCGRQGINGGYISNPLIRFGANCYGHKPLMTPEEEEIMATVPSYPLTKKDLEFEKRTEYWKSKIQDIIVSPFNKYQWSKI